jgi:hypothetical protein
MSDRIHTRLAAEGETWRRGLDPGPSMDELMPHRPPQRHSAVLPAIAAAAIVVAAAVIALVVRTNGGSHGRPASPAAHPAHCEDDFTAAPTRFHRTSAGQRLNLRLTYRGTKPCLISAYGPYVDLIDSGGRDLGQGRNGSLVLLLPQALAVEPNAVVTTTVMWDFLCPKPSNSVTAVRVHLDGSRATGTGGITVSVGATASPGCPPNTGSPVGMGFGRVTVTPSPPVVTGTLRIAGGPAPGTNHLVGGRISVYRTPATTGHPVLSISTTGEFVFQIEPGTYYLTGTTPSAPQLLCRGADGLHLVDGQRAQVQVICSLK